MFIYVQLYDASLGGWHLAPKPFSDGSANDDVLNNIRSQWIAEVKMYGTYLPPVYILSSTKLLGIGTNSTSVYFIIHFLT